ncbi:MAG: flagellar hook-basal body complex protein FliE, partial [Myxococcota bacterium]
SVVSSFASLKAVLTPSTASVRTSENSGPPTDSATTHAVPGSVGGPEFSDVLTEAVEGVRTAFKEAKDETTDALLGRGTPHQAMLAMAKADVTFRFVTQTRNKVVEAYREMMNLQV